MANWEDAPSSGWEDVPDNVSQIPGMQGTLDASRNVGVDDSSLLDKARGLLEAGASAVTGIPATIGEGFGQMFGLEPGTVSKEFYQPRTEKGKEYTEDIGEFANRYLNPLLGGIGHGSPETMRAKKVGEAESKVLIEKMKEAEKTAPKSNGWEDAPAKATDGPDGQIGLFDVPEAGRQMPNPYEVTPGDWRIDENGMPIKADLSMDAANTENVLQRNLFGDELAPKHELEGTPITEAMDTTRRAAQGAEDLPTASNERALMEKQVDLLRDEIEPPNELKTAVRDANEPLSRDGTGGDQSPMIGPGRRQAGMVNPAVFDEGFQKIKKVGEYTLELLGRSWGPEVRIYNAKGEDVGGLSTSAIYKGNEQNLTANFVRVLPSEQRQGLAREAYKFIAEEGNDIQKSSTLLPDGKKMWNRFEEIGLSKNGTIKSPGNRQQGVILFGGNQPIEKVLGKKDLIAEDPKVDAILPIARAESDSKAWNNTESGATLTAAKRRSTAIGAAATLVQNAAKRAFTQIRENVTPVERTLRQLSKNELRQLAEVFKEENFQNKRFGKEAIEQLSVKQQVAYAHFRKMMDDTLRIQNEARAAKGQPPITEREAYMSHRWDGDFRRALYEAVLNEDGSPKLDDKGNIQRKLVWYLADYSKAGLDAQTRALLKKRPDLIYDPKVDDHIVRFYKRQTDLQSAYTTMLDILGRDDPAVKKIQQVIEDQSQNEAATFLNQEKHFKKQSGVRGFVGDRPGKVYKVAGVEMPEWKRNPGNEALAALQQQIDYARNAYNWSEMQKAGLELKKIISDPELRQNQPHNMKYIRDYFKNAIGHGENAAIASLEDGLRDLGVSPDQLRKGIGSTKSFFIMQKIGASAGYAAANVIQVGNIVPHLLSSEYGNLIKRTGSLMTSIPFGITAGIATALGHYVSYIADLKKFDADKANLYMRAYKYAEDNGITMRSIMDDSPLSQSFSTRGRVIRGIGATISAPETFARSMAFMTAVESLRQTGKFTRDLDLFKKAEDLVNIAMVDYRTSEKPLMYRKLGMLGDFLNTLQTYPMNWYNQWNYVGREAFKGNAAPFAAMLAVQYAVAGAMGIPGFNDLDKLYQYIKDNWISSSNYVKAQQSEFWASPKLWLLHYGGSASVYGWLSDKTGLGLTSRVNAPGFSEMIQAPGGPAVDIAKQTMLAGKAALNPNRDTIAQSLMASVPTGLQGLVEENPAFQGSTFEKRGENTLAMMPGQIEKHKGVYERTPTEDTIRKFGLRSTNEMIGREVGYLSGKATAKSQEVARTIPDEFYAKLKVGDKNAAKDLYVAYVKLTGKGISDSQIEQQIMENYTTTAERSSTAAKSVSALQNVARMQQLLKQIRQEVGK